MNKKFKSIAAIRRAFPVGKTLYHLNSAELQRVITNIAYCLGMGLPADYWKYSAARISYSAGSSHFWPTIEDGLAHPDFRKLAFAALWSRISVNPITKVHTTFEVHETEPTVILTTPDVAERAYMSLCFHNPHFYFTKRKHLIRAIKQELYAVPAMQHVRAIMEFDDDCDRFDEALGDMSWMDEDTDYSQSDSEPADVPPEMDSDFAHDMHDN